MHEIRSDAAIRAVMPLEGKVSLREFEAYRAAGPLVRRELDDADHLRREVLRGRTAPRELPSAMAGRLLSLWNAYVLQVVGEHLLDAVRVRSFGTVRGGAVERIVAFLGTADRWMSQARHVAADASYRVEEQVHLPVEPPAWPNETYGPYPLSTAMVTALQAVHARATSIWDDHARSPVRDEDDLQWLRWMLDSATAAIEYATEPDHEERFWSRSIAAYLHYALRMLFRFGQAAAMPVLLDNRETTSVVSLAAPRPSRIDLWSLTDPGRRTFWRSQPSAYAQLKRMWAEDPRPAATAHVQAQIDAALRSGAIVFATDRTGERLGCVYRCPWPAVYEARRPVTVGTVRLMPMEHFAFDAHGETYGQGGRIVVSEFVPARAVIG